MSQKGFAHILLVTVLILVGIGIVGYFAYKKGQISTAPTSSSAPTIDETANWKTYRNDFITFKYPPNLKEETDTTKEGSYMSTLSFKSEDGIYRLILFFGLNMDSKPEELMEFIDRFSSNGGDKIKVDGQPAAVSQINTPDYPATITSYILSRDNRSHISVTLAVYSEDDRILINAKSTFDQILSTFKFLDSEKNAEGKFCGGIAANLPENQCPEGYKCKLDGNYPDAGGKCVKN